MGRGGFSWKRATELSSAKSRVSRSIGVPFTKSGRQRKVGKMATGGGCLLVIAAGICFAATVVAVARTVF